MTCKKVAKKWPRFTESGTKEEQIGESGGKRKNPRANPEVSELYFMVQ